MLGSVNRNCGVKAKTTQRKKPHCTCIVTASPLSDGCWRVIADVQYLLETQQSSGAAVTVLMCLLFIYCICLYVGGKQQYKYFGTFCHMESI